MRDNSEADIELDEIDRNLQGERGRKMRQKGGGGWGAEERGERLSVR